MPTNVFLRGRLKTAARVAVLGAETMLADAYSWLRSRGGAQPPPRDLYVQGVSATSAVIVWVGEKPDDVGLVEYGETPELGLQAVDARAGCRHAVALTGLSPGTAYYYRVAKAGGSGRFRTAPEGGAFSFAVIGDSGNGGKNQLAVAALLERLGPDLILHTGDVVYPRGEERHYERCFFAPYGRLIGGTPIFPTPGNHDLECGGDAYFENFHPPRDNPLNTRRYYSFDWGDVHFVALNSELYHDDESVSPEEQKVWLERDLQGSRQRWKVVYFHRPVYSSSDHGGDERVREDLEPVFVRHGVDLVFNGHDHDYERTVRIGGVTYVVSGGGGKALYPAGKGPWTAASRSAHHAVLVRADGERLSLEAVAPDGAVFDRFDLHRPGVRELPKGA